MLARTMKKLQIISKQSSFFVYIATPHIRTVASSAPAASSFNLLLPQDKQQHDSGLMGGCGKTTKLLHFPARITLPHINTTGKRIVSTFGDEIKNITVRSSLVGIIVGKGGERIRRIESESGAVVSIADANEGDSGNRHISIRGSDEQMRHAHKLIDVAVHQFTAHTGENTAKVTIPRHILPSLIGRGGEKIRELQVLSGAYIHVFRPEPGEIESQEKVVSIAGNPEQVKLAQELIQAHIDEKSLQDSSGTGKHTFRDREIKNIKVNASIVGAIIGRGGERIRGIQSESGAVVKISQSEGESTISIIGSDKQIQLAHKLIEEVMRVRSAHTNENTTKITVPNDMVPSLIGRRGFRINEFKRLSGAYIDISRRGPGELESKERVVTIAGNPEQVKLAQELIQERIDEESVVPQDIVDPKDVESIQMTVSNVWVGFLHGRGGERIREIQRNCGAKFDFSKVIDIDNIYEDRVMTISGSADQIQKGQQYVLELLRKKEYNII